MGGRMSASTAQRQSLASGRWRTLTLMEQMGNVGSEVGRARRWQGKDPKLFEGAILRSLELLDLTIQDSRWLGRLKELTRAREVLCDASLGGSEYASTLEDMERYFYPFALAARLRR